MYIYVSIDTVFINMIFLIKKKREKHIFFLLQVTEINYNFLSADLGQYLGVFQK